MSRKPDDQLFARIFDEGASGDESMEWLRDGLKELRAVPPHGLSNERLRDRLLGTGLAPVKPTAAPWWSWAWAPVAAAAIAVVVVPRLRSAEAPRIVDGSGVVATNVRPSVPPPIVTPATDGTAPALRVVPSIEVTEEAFGSALVAALPDVRSSSDRASSPPVRTTDSVAARVRRKTAEPRPRLDLGTVVARGGSAPALKERPTVALAPESSSLGSPGSSEAVALTERADPLVLLTSEVDAVTGAVSAIEVDSPANVSVGG